MRTIRRCLVTLVVIWSLAAGAIYAVRWSRPTPQRLMSYLADHPLQGLNSSGRAVVIDRAARLLNGLNSEQRLELKKSGVLRTFFTQLTSEERRRFASLTLPAGFRQMVKTLNKMNAVERKRVAERTLRDLRRQSAMATELSGEDDIRTMISQGASIFEQEASAEVKLDFAPIFEEYQRTRKEPAVSEALPNL